MTEDHQKFFEACKFPLILLICNRNIVRHKQIEMDTWALLHQHIN